MSRIGRIARRTFLLGSAAIAGGVAFGAYVVRRPHDNPLAEGLPEGAATFNPWVMIDAERITLITPHIDIGQGAVHIQAALIAEEMDLEFGQFETEFGPPSPAYWNRAFAEEAAAALAATSPMSQAIAHSLASAATKVLGVQGTGGSTSVPDSFQKLREAGAVARETLKAAAEKETGVARAEMRTEKGAVVLPDGTRLPYQALAGTAATLEPVTDVTLRDPSEWRLLGRPMQREDIVAKSTGTQRYGIDLALDGMVHAAVRLSPRRSPVESFDDGAARAVPGVIDVVPITNGLAVMARHTWAAMQGARALEVSFAPAPYPAEQAEHWTLLEQSFTEDRLDAAWREDGDWRPEVATVEATYRAPYVAHQPLEPMNAIVRVTDDGAEVWTGHQMPRFLQMQVASVTGHDAEAVTFHNQYSGGSFGHRLEFEHVKQAAEVARQMPGVPVKLTYSREEDFLQDFPRHIAVARAAGTVEGGRITGLKVDVAAPSVIASQAGRLGQSLPGPDSQITAAIWDAPYAPDVFHVRGYRAEGLAPTSSWRSVGASYGGFFIETLVDELAHAGGLDPVEARLGLISDPVARGVLEKAAEMANWGSDPGPGRARGVALAKSFGVPVAEIVEVADSDRGLRITRVWVASDSGPVLDPVNIENHIQGGVIWGLGHAMNSEITYADGMAQQTNYHDAPAMRLYQAPEIEVATLSANPSIKGIGEPPVPPAAPALGNAIFALTGTRLREMPFSRFVTFA